MTAVRRQTRGSTVGGELAALAVFLLLSLGVAALGSIATRSGQEWYDALEKPAFNPPDWTFGVVWTPLYVLIGIAGWLLWRKRGMAGAGVALVAWGVQLALNLAWSWVFFGAEQPGMALVEVVVFWLAIAATVALGWRVSRLAAVLLLPYLGWVAFASVLNFEVWRLN
ncbi:MAG: tryptophan-rich sensory protein [Dehalococcoidia bacterium]|nr:tryptophan-rich sensory protein [Dehalococcoidia bacterium]